MAVEYFGHEHPLILAQGYPEDTLWCEMCKLVVEKQEYPLWLGHDSSFYRCSEGEGCYFQLHKSCAELPRKIQHLLHPNHPLTLLPFNFTHRYDCNCCGHGSLCSFSYSCSLCQFKLCVNCVLPMVLNLDDYASHQHQPLIPLRMEAALFCEACGTEHRGIFFTCPTCIANSHTQFFIHQNCASLPQTFQHSGHHDHGDGDLILGYSIPSEYTLHNQYCKICLERVNSKYWVYYCGGCRYFVHINCATTTTSSVEEEEKTTSETIESCDEETDDRVENSLLESIHLPLHEPSVSLSLHVEPGDEETDDRVEKSLLEAIHLPLHESSVSLSLHVEPADHEETDDRVENSLLESIHLPLHEPSVSLLSYALHYMKLEDTQRTETLLNFNQFSHEHPLTFFDVQSEGKELCPDSKLSVLNKIKDDKICSGCIQCISNSPFYSCAQCDIFLHKCCAELPTTLEAPCDPEHQFILVAKASTPFNLFVCKYCNMHCSGFAYHCAICEFYIDVQCALLPNAITHEGHHPQHLLQFTKRPAGFSTVHCSSCYKSLSYNHFMYKCDTCSFCLDLICALLPHTIRQKYDELHPFTLCYYPIKEHPQEYICEVCEQDLDPSKWFYHCVECDKSIHIDCTYLGEQFRNVKFGGIFRTDHHEHPLTLVHKTKKPSICNTCDKDIKCDYVFQADSTLECSQCNFKMHLRCPQKKKITNIFSYFED